MSEKSLALIGNASGKVVPSGWRPCSTQRGDATLERDEGVATVATRQSRRNRPHSSSIQPNLINANGRRQALLVCAHPLINPKGHIGLGISKIIDPRNIGTIYRINNEWQFIESK
jgi:hypothetical protein